MGDIEHVRDEEGIDGEFRTYTARYGSAGDSREAAWNRLRDGYFFQRRKYVERMATNSTISRTSESGS